MRLAGTTPDFGYIPSTKRKQFLDFCVEHGFMEQYPSSTLGVEIVTRFNVLITFRYMGMLDYNPQPVVLVEEHGAMVDRSFKIRNLMKAN